MKSVTEYPNIVTSSFSSSLLTSLSSLFRKGNIIFRISWAGINSKFDKLLSISRKNSVLEGNTSFKSGKCVIIYKLFTILHTIPITVEL